jgi:phenol hydroxylase P0 protein
LLWLPHAIVQYGNPMIWSDTLTDLPAVNISRRFVRVVEERADGLVAFEFSVGWPELALELMLPTAAFKEFCAVNAVTFLTDTPPAGGNPEETEA